MAPEQIFEERGNKKLGRNLIGPDSWKHALLSMNVIN